MTIIEKITLLLDFVIYLTMHYSFKIPPKKIECDLSSFLKYANAISTLQRFRQEGLSKEQVDSVQKLADFLKTAESLTKEILTHVSLATHSSSPS